MANTKNAAIAFLAPLPSILFHLSFLRHSLAGAPPQPSPLFGWCRSANPLLLANLLFFANVDVLFWLVGLAQSSFWLIDLYWTVIPVLLLHFYASHPDAVADGGRAAAVTALTWAWSARLTHSYFRREGWRWGAREDWRFADMRREHGRRWWIASFFVVFLPQQAMLIGVCLPMYAVFTSDKPWNSGDTAAAAVCVAGIFTAYFADTQLHNFVVKNEKLLSVGDTPSPVLNTGLWRYSRHPNYVGEQLWWWGLSIFAWNVGRGWMVVGAAVNSLGLAYVTVLVERRMLRKEARAAAYRRYRRVTPAWIPWPFKKAVTD